MYTTSAEDAIPVHSLDAESLESWKDSAGQAARRWVENSGFDAAAGTHALLPDEQGELAQVLAGRRTSGRLWALDQLQAVLPPGNYQFPTEARDDQRQRLELGRELGDNLCERLPPELYLAVLRTSE